MKSVKTIIFLVLPMMFLASCHIKEDLSDLQVQFSDNPEGNVDLSYIKISAEEALDMMNNSSGYILLDVRTHEEFIEKRIEGAVLIPYNEIELRAKTEIQEKDILILIYCRSGRRSEIAANELIGMGYTNVFDIGGLETDWIFDTIHG